MKVRHGMGIGIFTGCIIGIGVISSNVIAAPRITGSETSPTLIASQQGSAAHGIDPDVIVSGDGSHSRFAILVRDAAPGIVNVHTSKTVVLSSSHPDFFGDLFGGRLDEGFGNRRRPQEAPAPRHFTVPSLGTGFVISTEGLIVTNNHVVEGVEKIEVVFSDGTRSEAEVVGTDPKTDIALIRAKSDRIYHPLTLGDSDALLPGDWVIAVGNPFGLDNTVTTGIVSARGRAIGSGPYDDFLQIDASINKGNSGGPSFNLAGQVIGVNTAIFSPNGGSVGIGFAIPAALAQDVIAQLKANGRVARGWLGVHIQGVTAEVADSLGLKPARGAIVARVLPDAAHMGLYDPDIAQSHA